MESNAINYEANKGESLRMTVCSVCNRENQILHTISEKDRDYCICKFCVILVMADIFNRIDWVEKRYE